MKYCIWMSLILIVLGCAKVSLQTSEPIKVDINMRLDIYQHAVDEVDSIEDQIYGGNGSISFKFPSIMRYAYAADDQQAVIARRKARATKIEALFASGKIGEDKDALLKVLDKSLSMADQKLVKAENKDRESIYMATAKKMDISDKQMIKIFFDDHYKRAKKGYMFEIKVNGNYEWKKK